MRLTPLLGFALLGLACTPGSDSPAVAKAAPLSVATLDSVRAVDAAFAAAMNAKDTLAVFAVYAENALVMPPDAPILAGTDWHPVIVGLLAAGAGNFVLTPTTTYGVGDLAYSVGTVTFTMGDATQTMKFSEVLQRGADGQWRYVVDMFSSVAPPAPAAAPAK